MSQASARLQMLMAYTTWANARVYASVAGLPATALTAPTPVFAGSILRTLHHVYLIDAVWQARLTGTAHPYTSRNPETAPPFPELRAAQHLLDDWYVHYARGLRVQATAGRVDFEFIGGGQGSMTRAEILLHVANHTSYHRGHLTAMLAPLGVPLPTTDLPVYLRDAARADPAARGGALKPR